MKKLPKPKNKYGYTYKEVLRICAELKVDIKDFNNAFGINTCTITKKGEIIYYTCDVERTLWDLGFKKLGKFHLWD